MRSDHSQPFDQPFDREADDTAEFWGATRSWEPRPASGAEADGDGAADGRFWSERTGSIGAIKHNLSGYRNRRSDSRDRTRSHGIVRPATAPEPIPEALRQETRREATLGELAAGWPGDDDDWGIPTQRVPATQVASTASRPQRRPEPLPESEYDEDELIPLSPVAPLARRLGLGAVDPLLARLSAIIVIGVLLVPVALALRSGKGESLVSAEAVGTGATAGLVADGAPTPGAATTTPATIAATLASQSPQTSPVQTLPAPAAQSESVAAPTTTLAAATDVSQSNLPATTIVVEPATVAAEAERVEPVCALTYSAGPGDSWYRIAEEAGITPGVLTQTNLASLDTTIFPGDEICLPEGATMPSPPTTAAPTTQAPSTTQPPTTTVNNTQAPTTSKPPTASATTAQVQQLIRDIWPDELEEKALQIAWRESSYKATAFNGSCCYGVFQLHWTSHKSWLDDYGILTSSDLFDARKNITAAYALYQRSGGWGPWGG